MLLFFLCFFGITIAEAFWIASRNDLPFGRTFLFSFSTNIFTVCIGFFVSFVIFGIILALAWDGSLEKVPGGDFTIWTAVTVAALFPVVLLIISKRVAAALFKLRLARPWPFSILSSLAFFLVTLGLPVLAVYLI